MKKTIILILCCIFISVLMFGCANKKENSVAENTEKANLAQQVTLKISNLKDVNVSVGDIVDLQFDLPYQDIGNNKVSIKKDDNQTVTMNKEDLIPITNAKILNIIDNSYINIWVDDKVLDNVINANNKIGFKIIKK